MSRPGTGERASSLSLAGWQSHADLRARAAGNESPSLRQGARPTGLGQLLRSCPPAASRAAAAWLPAWTRPGAAAPHLQPAPPRVGTGSPTASPHCAEPCPGQSRSPGAWHALTGAPVESPRTRPRAHDPREERPSCCAHSTGEGAEAAADGLEAPNWRGLPGQNVLRGPQTRLSRSHCPYPELRHPTLTISGG